MKRISVVLLILVFMLSSCNSNKNPFLESWKNREYNVPPFSEIKEGHYLPAMERAIVLSGERIQKIVNNKEEATFENTIVALDKCNKKIHMVSSVLFNVYHANANDSLTTIVQKIQPMLSVYSDNVYMNPFLFRRVKRLVEQVEKGIITLNEVDKKLLDDVYKDFVRSGANLKSEEQERLKAVNLRMGELQNKFALNMLKATADYVLLIEDEADLEGLSEDYKAMAKKRAEDNGNVGWQFGLDNPSVMSALQYIKSEEIRKQLLEAYTNRCNEGSEYDNTKIVQELLALRSEKAKIMDKSNYSEYVLEERMAKNSESVYKLLDEIWGYALDKAKEELKELQDYRLRNEVKYRPIQAWDWRYYANLVKNEKYVMDEEEIRAYFSVDAVRDGIFNLCERLYGISFTEDNSLDMPTPNTTAYVCKEKDGSVLGILYLDMHPRVGEKSGGAWNTNYVEQIYENGQRITPVTSIVCNFTPPTGDKPSLLTLDETETYFHEFGHALHNLFADVKHLGLSSVPLDFVELPSQIMEHWALHPQMLKAYAKHYQTGEVISDDLIKKIQDAAKYGQGFATTEFIAAALLDMDYHTLSSVKPNMDLNKFEASTLNKRGLLQQIPSRYRTNYFAHVMSGGYTAGYYVYSWAEVLDADAFMAFEESGDIFNKELAESFRGNILSKGGMYNAMDMYKSFRGREPEVKALLQARGFVE